ncbi:MAG: signal peptidase I [Oscillospiraceae bacterium]|nr:signal peptidase I [Oscillospiraceae bacterium]
MREYVQFSKNQRIHRFIGGLLDALSWAITPVMIAELLLTYVFQVAIVQGDSMLPTLADEDKLLICEFSGRPDPGDIVVINAENSVLIARDGSLIFGEGLHKSIVKRVIAVGGQILDIDPNTGIVYLNGEPQEELYANTITQLPDLNNAFVYPLMIPEGFVFVMGDNRDVSMDSRYSEVGLVPEDSVAGAVLMRIYPLERIGRLENDAK